MKTDQRPYAGTWSSEFQQKHRTVESWTPDAIVQFNGDTTLPGCPECKNRIDFSSFINSVNTGCSVSGVPSCSINFTIPKSYGDLVYKDGEFILTTGIEINVYYRGFFKTAELTAPGDEIELQLEEGGSETILLNEVEARPYYPVFHGFISGVSVNYADNAYKVSISARPMISLWDNQFVNENQGYFAADPKEARGNINLQGHVYTNMTAHQIIYDLFRDAGGTAQGTNFVLQQKSNLLGKVSTGQQFYSMYLRYLENRWQNGLYGLKMFGVSGRMYNSLEQAILVDTTPYGKDNEFKSVVKGQLKQHTISRRNSRSVLSNLMKAGFVAQDAGGRLVRGLDVRQLPSIEDKKEDPVNVLSLQEFITDLGALGQVNFFQSNYSSKKSLADKVAERVGYEFYQDFDGNLVFKPPMYNMNTSGDRVYRIERRHTLDISFEHAEPEYTYVVCSGGPFRNIKVASLEGEWGIKGMYVDYKLVAKYGWKEMSFDTTYYNSARKAFYAAVVALDSANKSTETCSITIPLRPEIKPGYPIYVEENDCFYYVEQVDHSFSFGGDCTTSLSLTCQRKKFFPPGDPDIKYSEDPARAVDLGDPSMPKKYLYRRATANDVNGDTFQTKKLQGFPNVVMALDPYKMDPSFLTYSLDYQSMGRIGSEVREAYRNMLLMEGKKYGIIQTDEGGDLFNGPWKIKIGDQEGVLGLEKEGTQYLRRDNRGRYSYSKLSRRTISQRNVILGESALEKATYEKVKADERASKLAGKSKYASGTRIDEAKQIRETAQRTLEEAIEQLRSPPGSTTFTIYDLILAIREQRKTEVDDGTLKTSNILRLLENKKSSFAPHLPGYYRYFSSSHPSPEHQGPPVPSVKPPEGEDDMAQLYFEPSGSATVSDLNIVYSDPELGGDVVEFEQSRGSVVRGIFARTLFTRGFEVVPTKDIKTLTFSTNYTITEDTVEVGLTFDPSKWETESGFGRALRQNIVNVIKATIIKKYKPTTTVNTLNEALFRFDYANSRQFPSRLIYGSALDPNTRLKDLPFGNNNKAQVAAVLATETAFALEAKLKGYYPELYQKWTGTAQARTQAIIKILSDVQKAFVPSIKGGFYKGRSRKEVRRRFKKGKMFAPVFPVSDDQGYEVFGAYQYGRGLKPARKTLFDILLRQDPLGILTQRQIADLRESLSSYESIDAFNEELRNTLRSRMDEIMSTDKEAASRIYAAYGLNIDDQSVQFDPGLRHDGIINLMMSRSDEQVITNTPKALSEIRPPSRSEAMCSCKGNTSEADLLYSALDLENTIVEIENPLIARSLRKSRENKQTWEEHQKALRGSPIAGANRANRVGKLLEKEIAEWGQQVDQIVEATDDLTQFIKAKTKRGENS